MDEEIKLAAVLSQLRDNPAWRHLQQLVNDRVKAAHDNWIGCASSDPYVLFGVQRTYRATLAFANEINNEFAWADQKLKDYADEQQQAAMAVEG